MAGSRDVIREAFKAGLISDGEKWMEMLQSRNLTSHSYNEDTADEIANSIVDCYYSLFTALEIKMQHLSTGNQNDLFEK